MACCGPRARSGWCRVLRAGEGPMTNDNLVLAMLVVVPLVIIVVTLVATPWLTRRRTLKRRR